MIEKLPVIYLRVTHQGSYAEFTVAQKLNQGTIRQKGGNPRPTGHPGGFCRGPFLSKIPIISGVLFWATCPDPSGSKKSDKRHYKLPI